MSDVVQQAVEKLQNRHSVACLIQMSVSKSILDIQEPLAALMEAVELYSDYVEPLASEVGGRSLGKANADLARAILGESDG